MASKNYVPVYVDRPTGNHWVISEGRNGLLLSSVNAIQKPGSQRKRFIGHFTGDPIGFVAHGEVIEIRWDVTLRDGGHYIAFNEKLHGDAKVSEHKRAWKALREFGLDRDSDDSERLIADSSGIRG